MVMHDEPLRRMTVVSDDLLGTPERAVSSGDRDDDDPESDADSREPLAAALELLAADIRAGVLRQDPPDGVLLDVVIGNVRCQLTEHAETLMVSLSPRERQIARMVAAGRTNQAMASALDISVWTVSTHMRRIFAKLAVSNRAEMVAHVLLGSEQLTQDPPRRYLVSSAAFPDPRPHPTRHG